MSTPRTEPKTWVDRELYVMRTKMGRVHLIEVVPAAVGQYQIWMDGHLSSGGAYWSDTALTQRLAFLERLSADWREVEPIDAGWISEDRLCP